MKVSKVWVRDVCERVGWTALQAALGVLTTNLTGLPVAYAVPVAAGLSALKGWVATQIGDPNSAATLPDEGTGV